MYESCITNRSVNTPTQLDELVAQLSARVEAREPIDLVALTADCPQYREQLEMLLPTLQAVVDLEHSLENKTVSLARSNRNLTNVPCDRQQDEAVAGQLGDFRILRELGRGGMGIVYEAEQISLGRRVALKVLPFAAMLDKQQLARFKNEARAAATLDHPNIVAVYSVGVDRGVHYYAMQLVEGQSLAQVVAQLKARNEDRAARSEHIQSAIRIPQSEIATVASARLSTLPDYSSREYFRTIAQLGIQAAEALDHAHQNGILHRDVKPANLLVDGDGKLWITDFGLARIEQDAGMTMTGDILGTLRYMSPEQALARRAVVDHRSDIYSLGATLYELLTLRPPFDGDDRQELLRQIAFDEPKKPRQLNSRIPQDLDTIVLKAIEKNPADRFPTAQELANDIQRFLASQPIKARLATRIQRVVKWSRRHTAFISSAAAILLVSTTILAASSLRIAKWYGEAMKSGQRARQVADENKAVVDFLVNELLAAPIEEAEEDREITVSEVLVNAENRIATALTEQPLVEAAVRHAMARSYQALRKFDKAEPHARRALELRTRLLGPTHHDALDSTTTLVEVLIAREKSDEARQICRDALEVTRRTLGNEHVETIASMNRMVWFMIASPVPEDADYAARLCNEAIEAGHRELGAEHRETLRAMSFKALLLYEKGDQGAAEELVRSCLTLSQRALGQDDPLTLEFARDIAFYLAKREAYLDAMPIYQDVLARQLRTIGPIHPDTIRTRNELGETLNWLNRYSEAQELFEEGLATVRQLFGPDHPATISWKQNLVFALRRGRNYAESYRLQKEVFEQARRHFGPEDRTTLWAMEQLAYDLHLNERFEESIVLNDEVLTIGRRVLDPHSDLLLSAMSVRSSSLRSQGKLAEAREAMTEVVATLRRLPPSASRGVDTYLGPRLALLRWHAADNEIAEAKKMLDEIVKLLPPNNWFYRNHLAWFLVTRPSAELRDGKLGLELAAKACQLTDYKSATVLDTLAAAYAEIGDFPSAVLWSQKAVKLAESPTRRESYEARLARFQRNEPWRNE